MKKISIYLLTILLIILTIFIYIRDKELDDIFPFLDKGIGHWEKTGNMINPRGAGTSAVLLADGNVLISGGYDGKQYLKSAEIYYPKENVFKPVGNLTQKRFGHLSFLLNNGEVVILGGITNDKKGYTDDVEIYNPKNKKFIKTDQLPERFSNDSILMNNGYIFSQNAIYNPSVKDYKKININYARIGTIPVEFNGNVYVINGMIPKDYPYGKLNNKITPKKGDGFIYTNIIEKFDFANNSYSIKGKSVIPKTASGLIALPDGKILIVGGHVYKSSGTGSDNGILDYDVYRHNIMPLYKSKFKKHYWWWKDSDQNLEIYDTTNNTSKIVGQKLQYAFGNHSNSDLILLKNRYVFVANGCGRRAEIIDTKTWINYPVKKMPKPLLTNSIPIKIDENTILFIGEHIYKSLPYVYIFRLDNIKE